jgi:hypothetical protein
MYNTTVICTYNTPDVFLETDDITDDDKEFVRQTLYRQELLDVLGIEEYDEEKIGKVVNDTYERVKECCEIKECIDIVLAYIISTDKIIGFMLLLSYDCLYISHICISEFLETGKVSSDNITMLKKSISVL